MDLTSAALFAASMSFGLLTSGVFGVRNPNSERTGGQHVRKQKREITQPSPEIKAEMLSRIISFFGTENFSNIQNAFVIVVGLGGVGSHAVNMLVRSGVSHVRMIDFDNVTLSSLNRHALASFEDVGISKTLVLKKRLLEIAPWAQIDAVTEMFIGAHAERLLRPFELHASDASGNMASIPPTYVLDCIDDVSTKAELIAYCVKNNLKILTSMGAGGKSDPTRLRIGQLSDCINDPLCQKIKWKLKKHGVAAEDVTGVYSNEKPCVDLLPLTEEQAAAPHDFGAVDYLRLRTIPVLGTSPAIFGQAMASKILCALGQQEYMPESGEHMSKNLKHKLLQTCKSWETRRFGDQKDVDLDDDDIEFIATQVWGNRCAVTGKRFGGHQPLVLIRWRKDLPPTPDNLVLMSMSFAQEIVDEETAASKNAGGNTPGIPIATLPKSFDQAVLHKIEQRLRWARTAVGDAFGGQGQGSVVSGGEKRADMSRTALTGSDESFARGAVSQRKYLIGVALGLVAAACSGATFGYAAAVAKAYQLGYELL
jgi:tRNA A37 threonylcarbamoyladenosine dehydratase